MMIAPPNPYRCPPGPYERVSMMAHVLKAKGHKKSRSSSSTRSRTSPSRALFVEGWEKHYPGMVEWQDPKMHGGIKSVDAKTMTVKTDLAEYKAQLINVIPAQMAGKIARDAGLANQTGFCPINPENMRSAVRRQHLHRRRRLHPGRHAEVGVLGQQPGQGRGNDDPRRARQRQTFPARYTNTCWSLIETDDTVKVGGTLRGEGRQDRGDGDIHLQDR